MLRGTYQGGAAGTFALPSKARVALAIFGCAFVATGCNTSGQPVLDLTVIGAPGVSTPRTVAFEWINGAPEPFLRRLAAQLSQEATARQIASVSREQPSQYRISGYMAAHVQGQRTTITWVWDVFTADHSERVLRLTGEAPGAPSERAWAAADDAVVTRIAQDTMSRLAVFLAAQGPAPVASASTAAQAPLAFLPAVRP